MLPDRKKGFVLDPRLEGESFPVAWLGLCELRIRDEKRWPWLLLIPQRPGVEEVHDLTPLDQAMLSFETNMVSKALKEMTGCTKINCGALGNIVRQLHLHIIARNEGDSGWPGAVWGYGAREPYKRETLHDFAEKLRCRL
ncbi:HIT family protein [Chelativorans sp. Marseille-P2723]|uniref:HIT family protein n=1 Tax=Chelativorans sp. Marseille-P2723 TaxID=2709133 RepID=UPI0015714DC0|nr:HIT family protein [Chelativorans sp. Marseille-P2723]